MPNYKLVVFRNAKLLVLLLGLTAIALYLLPNERSLTYKLALFGFDSLHAGMTSGEVSEAVVGIEPFHKRKIRVEDSELEVMQEWVYILLCDEDDSLVFIFLQFNDHSKLVSGYMRAEQPCRTAVTLAPTL